METTVIAEQEEKRRKGGLIRKPGSGNLYVHFHYLGERIEFSTRDPDTPANRRKWEAWLDRNMAKIAVGNFEYARAFPGASEEKKAHFARLEQNEYEISPSRVFFGDYAMHYIDEVLPTFRSENKRAEYKQAIKIHILPHFRGFTFRQITRIQVGQFINQMKRRDRHSAEKAQQAPLSRKRILNVLTPLRSIWNAACDEYHFDLRDPFKRLEEYLPEPSLDTIDNPTKTVGAPKVWRFEEVTRILKHVDPFYRPATELMFLTGLIASEIAGLRKSDIVGDYQYLLVQNFIAKKQEKATGKAPSRQRRIPITAAIRRVLEQALEKARGEYLFPMKRSPHFLEGSYRNNAWTPAIQAAGLEYKTPYSMRHTFAAWALTIDADKNMVVSRMGHSSKKMVYEVYGEFVEGLQKDRELILGYFGEDFLK